MEARYRLSVMRRRHEERREQRQRQRYEHPADPNPMPLHLQPRRSNEYELDNTFFLPSYRWINSYQSALSTRSHLLPYYHYASWPLSFPLWILYLLLLLILVVSEILIIISIVCRVLCRSCSVIGSIPFLPFILYMNSQQVLYLLNLVDCWTIELILLPSNFAMTPSGNTILHLLDTHHFILSHM